MYGEFPDRPHCLAPQVRVRHFDIKYHMEDASCEITEPVQANTGLTQGKYLQRHKCVREGAQS